MKSVNKFGEVFWTYKDLSDSRPDWSKEQCEDFLSEHCEDLKDAMIDRGWNLIESLLDEDEANDNAWERMKYSNE